ncbi:transcription factor BHLH42 isoform X2 [Physcomitrium patens]|uniref:transcription factor BHLH42 isoform X2 n=1 Tax=Physcomitrium patens TaxID=3218 RepID=UPI003CCCB6ED
MSSYPQVQIGITGVPLEHQYQHIQRQLQNLLQQLRWSYVALWSLSHLAPPQTRSLGWRGGHFRVNSTEMTTNGAAEAWNEHLFKSTYQLCTFTPGLGSVGMAHAEGRNFWMNGSSVHLTAGSMEQAQFLQHAGIETAMCIPWSDSVLELGTTERVAEDPSLMERIRGFMTEIIPPALPDTSQAQQNRFGGTSITEYSPFSCLSAAGDLPDNLNYQAFDSNSLNQQLRSVSPSARLATSEMVLVKSDDSQVNYLKSHHCLDTGLLPDPAMLRFPRASRSASDILQMQHQVLPPASSNQFRGRCRSHSSTTSPSASNLEGRFNTRLSNSPENINTTFSRSRNSRSTTSSSSRRGTPSQGPEFKLENTNTYTGLVPQLPRDDDEIQKVLTFMQDGGESLGTHREDWQDLYKSSLETENVMRETYLPSSSGVRVEDGETELGSVSWQRTRAVGPILDPRNDRRSPVLERKAARHCKEIPSLQQGTQNSGAAGQQQPVLTFSGAETSTNTCRGQDAFYLRRVRRVSRIASLGPVNGAHEDAAVNHMMAERRRRVKQKENFTALRKLVPIISKADKASTLGDAIIYLKELQMKIEELKASTTKTENRYKILELSYYNLKKRNEELESITGDGDFSYTHPLRKNSYQ